LQPEPLEKPDAAALLWAVDRKLVLKVVEKT
jgi:hypothetical protein